MNLPVAVAFLFLSFAICVLPFTQCSREKSEIATVMAHQAPRLLRYQDATADHLRAPQ